MGDIDNLRGHALNCAVAEALGWVQDKKHLRWWMDQDSKGHRILLDMDERVSRDVSPSIFDPAHYIDQAWSLDGKNWHWSFDEVYNKHNDDNPTSLLVSMCAIGQNIDDVNVRVELAAFNSKAEAYATARTIAWLKTQQ